MTATTMNQKLREIAATKQAELAACARELAMNFDAPSASIIQRHLGITPGEYCLIEHHLMLAEDQAAIRTY